MHGICDSIGMIEYMEWQASYLALDQHRQFNLGLEEEVIAVDALTCTIAISIFDTEVSPARAS